MLKRKSSFPFKVTIEQSTPIMEKSFSIMGPECRHSLSLMQLPLELLCGKRARRSGLLKKSYPLKRGFLDRASGVSNMAKKLLSWVSLYNSAKISGSASRPAPPKASNRNGRPRHLPQNSADTVSKLAAIDTLPHHISTSLPIRENPKGITQCSNLIYSPKTSVSSA